MVMLVAVMSIPSGVGGHLRFSKTDCFQLLQVVNDSAGVMMMFARIESSQVFNAK